jgi:Xaa-Pro dipeptidase
MYSARQSRLREEMRPLGIDALALIPGPNSLYLTGLSLHVSERPVLFILWREEQPTLILPAFERGKTSSAEFELRVVTYGEHPGSQRVAFREAISRLDAIQTRLALAPFEMRAYEMGLLEEAAPQAQFVSGERLLEPLRQIKEQYEIGCMRQAVDFAQRAMQATRPLIRVGITERELASELMIQLLRAGSDPEPPFYPIVASGPNSALPHAVPSDRRLQEGDFLIIDWGATHRGYASDLTRTFALAEINPELEHVYHVVQRANAAGVEAVRPGQPAEVVDQAARRVIETAGYGPQFHHRTGHGLGLQAHEPPYIRAGNRQPLEAGMTFTVEPGVYIEGLGGVRIEDDVLVTAQGGERLSDFGRTLEVIA